MSEKEYYEVTKYLGQQVGKKNKFLQETSCMDQTLLDGSVAPKTEFWYRWLGVFTLKELEIDGDPPDWSIVLDKRCVFEKCF